MEMARLTSYEATVAQMATTKRSHSSTSLLVALTTHLSPDPRNGPSKSMSTESLLPVSMCSRRRLVACRSDRSR